MMVSEDRVMARVARKERRVKIFCLDYRYLHAIFEGRAKVLNLPSDFEVLHAVPNIASQSIEFLVASEEFQPVAIGCEAMRFWPDIQVIERTDDGEYTRRIVFEP
jgi:hypothetical protein